MDALLEPTLEQQNEPLVEEPPPVFMSRRRAQVLEKKLLVSAKHRNVNSALRRVCYTLYDVLSRSMCLGFVPDNEFANVAYCRHVLKTMGLNPKASEKTDKSINDLRVDVIRHSFVYRNMRNKMVASLSIIADLPDRGVSAGSEEFQKGMREGYRRASEVAVMFLNDLLLEE